MNFGELFLWTIFILLMILLVIHYETWNTKTVNPKVNHKHPKPKKNLNSKRGESNDIYYNVNNGIRINDPTTCESVTSYYDDKCICKTPFFGPKCNEERLNPNYYDAGKSSFTETSIPVNRLSYKYNSLFMQQNQKICTDLCDADTTCLGVKYSQGETFGVKKADSSCYLIKDLSNLGNLEYDPDAQGNTFLKKKNFPFFPDTGLAYVDSLPMRYWIETDTNSRLGKIPKLVRLLKNDKFTYPTHVKADVPGTFSFSNDPTMANPIIFTLTDKLEIPIIFESKTWNKIYGTFVAA